MTPGMEYVKIPTGDSESLEKVDDSNEIIQRGKGRRFFFFFVRVGLETCVVLAIIIGAQVILRHQSWEPKGVPKGFEWLDKGGIWFSW